MATALSKREDALKLRSLSAGLTAAMCLTLVAVAHARNPHCAGGIQYVVQGLRDNAKGNKEDYMRQMNKAVDQLSMCATEDGEDHEALGYLAWAYAELDSMGPAGDAFTKAIAGLTAKGDKKRLEVVANNRESYWANRYNEGIHAVTDAQGFLEAGAKEEAHAKFEVAIVKLTQAKLLKPSNAGTMRNLAVAYAADGRFDEAEAVLRNGLTEAAGDSNVVQLQDALRITRANKAGKLLDEKKYDEAIAYYTELVKNEPNSADHLMGLGNAYFSRAGGKQDAAKKADYKLSGDAYAKAFQVKKEDANLVFNAALAYQNAGELALAEGQWRDAVKLNAKDAEALSSLGSVLADESKFDEAVRVLHQAVGEKPDNKIYFRQLGAAYSKSGNNTKSTEMLMLYLAMDKGTAAADAAAAAKAAKAGTAAANTLGAMGSPDKVLDWDYDNRKLQTWVFSSKQQAFTFDSAAGSLVQKSDWNPPAAKK